MCESEEKAYALVLLHIRHQSFCILIHLSPSMLGNCLYVAGEYARAKEIFLEAGPRSSCLAFFLSFFLFLFLLSLVSLLIHFLLVIYSFFFLFSFIFPVLLTPSLTSSCLYLSLIIVGVEADCVEGLYNLGLVNLKLNAEQEAHNAFDKLHTILPR